MKLRRNSTFSQRGFTGSYEISVELYFTSVPFIILFIFETRNLQLSGQFPPSKNNCHLLLKWTLPAGTYVDPYQLQDLIQNRTLRFEGHVDVEKMAHHSLPLTFYSLEKLLCGEECHFSASIPVHCRYHSPGDDRNNLNALVTMSPPSVYSSCIIVENCLDESNVFCEWEVEKVLFSNQKNQITIPIGDLSHSPAVTLITISTTFLGIIFLAKAA